MQDVNQMCCSVLGGMVLAVWSAVCTAEPSIPLHVSLEILDTCTIGRSTRPGAGPDMPSVTCSLGTPFMLTHVAMPGARAAPPRSLDGVAAAAWTVTF